MWKDPIVEEIRAIRDEHARRFDYNLEAICRDLREREARSGHQVVSLAPKRPRASDVEQGTGEKAV